MASTPSSNLIKASISQAAKLVRRCIEVQRPVFLHGAPGIGKSALADALARESNRALIDIRLTLFDPSDLRGIPHLAGDGQMKWSVPSELPQPGRMRSNVQSFHKTDLVRTDAEGNIIASTAPAQYNEENAILFLDELNSAPASVQAAAYQLILDRKIGEYCLPGGVAVIAAGNRSSDRGVTNRMPSPLANRFAHIEIEPVFDDWVEWASRVGVKPEIIGFLSTARQNWNCFEQSKDALAFATPRSWDFVSRTLSAESDKDEAFQITAMYVGQGVASDFVAYRELALKVPDARAIFSGKMPNVKDFKINILYTLVYNLMYGLRDMAIQYGVNDQRVHDATNNTLIFIAESMPPELAILTGRTLSGGFGVKISKRHTPAFDTVFWPKVQKYLTNQ